MKLENVGVRGLRRLGKEIRVCWVGLHRSWRRAVIQSMSSTGRIGVDKGLRLQNGRFTV